MKKAQSIFLLLFLSIAFTAHAADQPSKHYEGQGEVLSVDPLYSRITIKHEQIKGLPGGPETEFFVSSADILKGINKRDLVDFTVVDIKGDTQIEKITKTGEAPLKEEKLEIGKAVQDVLIATGEVAKTVTGPVPPANEVVAGAVGATTDTTGAVLDNVEGPEVKSKF